MGEQDVIARTEAPATTASLLEDLRSVGVESGATLMVHASLSGLGFVAGGAHAVVLALMQAVGPNGTLVMPTHSTDLTDPAGWSDPPVPVPWHDRIRAGMPAFDRALTPTRLMGAVVECFRHVPGVIRSDHPTVSAAALGPAAMQITADHRLRDGLGDESPQGRLYELDSEILLLGVRHSNNTSLHLAERRAAPPDARWRQQASPIMVDGERAWVTYEALVDDVDDFDRIGDAFAATGAECVGLVGAGTARLMSSRAVVDFATDWMRVNRTWPLA